MACPRPQWLPVWVLALGCGLAGCGSCGGSEPPAPQKVAEIEPTVKPKVKPKRRGPFSNPNIDAPGPRTETQLPTKKLEATIARGRKLAEDGRDTVAIQTLRKCANRIPQSVECEAELALTMFADNQHVAHARYYLSEAARGQPPVKDDELYRRMGEMAMRKSLFPTAANAYGLLRGRGTATADDLEQLAHALQASDGSKDEAADAYARAYELDATRHPLLRKRATLLAQVGDPARAADLFAQYLEKGEPTAEERTALEQRIVTLRAEADAMPKAAPEDAAKGDAKAPAPQ